MKPQPTIDVSSRFDWGGPPPSPDIRSLLPGTDWFLFGGVAIQADPCMECRCTAIDPDGTVGPDFECTHARCHERGAVCHGLGIIPKHGSIYEADSGVLRLHASVLPGKETVLVLVVPMKEEEK